MNDKGQNGAGRLRKNFRAMLNFIASSTKGRHIKEVQGFMLHNYGITPATCNKYLKWAEEYGDIRFTSPARNRVKTMYSLILKKPRKNNVGR